MYTYIKKLQSKSEETRKKILVGSLVVCMAVVATIWIGSLRTRIIKAKVAESNQDVIKPFALFKQSISNTIDSITASVGNAPSFKNKVKKIIPKSNSDKQIDLTVVEYK